MKGLFVFLALCVAVSFAVYENPAEIRKKFLEEVKSRQPDAYKAILRKATKARHAPRNRKPATIPPEIAEQVKELEENARRDMQISVKEGEVPSIPFVNKPFADLLFQGDMLLTEEQEKEQELEKGDGSRAKRQVQTGPEYPKNKWAPGVPIAYRFESSIDSYTRDLIRKSFKFWEEHSCLSFAENGTALPRLRFFKGQGCYSLVGKVYQQEEQEISIGDGCEMFGTVTHEIAHSLGLFHHHSRSDRDDFITVLTANLRPGWDRQFAKETPAGSSNLDVHYDYGSNMHYTGFDPATNKIMFLAKDKHYQHTMGNHYGPVFSDILLLNRYYQCSDKCPGAVKCRNGGFPHPRNCRTCICPDGFGGNDCSERAAPESGAPADCGRIVQATAQLQTLSGSVKSGPLGGPSNIADRHAVCYYHIRAPAGKRIEIKVNKFLGSCMNECVLGGVEIKYDNLTRVGAHLCCPGHLKEFDQVTSSGDLAIISVYSQRGQQSFELQYRAVDKSGGGVAPPRPQPPPSGPSVPDRPGPQPGYPGGNGGTHVGPPPPPPQTQCFDRVPYCDILTQWCGHFFMRSQMAFMCARTCRLC